MLSTTMAPLGQNQRWIIWTLEPGAHPKQKPRKVPRNPFNGHQCNPVDRANWATYEQALAATQARPGHGLGYVFHEGDGLFFLDIDNCVENGTWTQQAQNLMNMWGGHVAIEVSQSGTGLHIFGYASTIPVHGCKNIPLGLELYHHERFVAFTDDRSLGAIDQDVSPLLAGLVTSFFPKTAASSDVVDWCDEGDGASKDDQVLLEIMLRSKSNKSTFGGGATFAELWTAQEDALTKAYPSTNGYDCYDRSSADSALAALLVYWCGGNMTRVEKFMRESALVRDKWDDRPAYLETTIINAARFVKNRATPRDVCAPLSEDERRQKQRELTRQIGEGSDTVPTTAIFTLHEMLERFVFITEGSQVADRLRPQVVLPLPEFKSATAASMHLVPREDGSLKSTPCTGVWLKHPDRKDAETLTFRAGASVMTVSPAHGKSALNLWSAPVRDDPPQDWEGRAALFVQHVHWLWGEHAEAFLDWLAHIEQRPGELPHYGWVHISLMHGKGRNWISAVLARLWRGNVAASFDLLGALEGRFNDRLSRCLVAIVDEINEGGNGSWRHAQALRQMVTAEHREINPKYGRRHVEYNSTRWLLFSNHTAALPLGDEDRRFWVVDHEGPVKPPPYYRELYAALYDPLFIVSLAKLLNGRDISNFDAGLRPPSTKAKAALIALSQSESDATLAELVHRWPVDVITWSELQSVLADGQGSTAALRHSLDRAGMKKIRKVRVGTKTDSAYSVRNHVVWSQAKHLQLVNEINRFLPHQKETAMLGE